MNLGREGHSIRGLLFVRCGRVDWLPAHSIDSKVSATANDVALLQPKLSGIIRLSAIQHPNPYDPDRPPRHSPPAACALNFPAGYIGHIAYMMATPSSPPVRSSWYMVPLSHLLVLIVLLAAPILGVVAWRRWRRRGRCFAPALSPKLISEDNPIKCDHRSVAPSSDKDIMDLDRLGTLAFDRGDIRREAMSRRLLLKAVGRSPDRHATLTKAGHSQGFERETSFEIVSTPNRIPQNDRRVQ